MNSPASGQFLAAPLSKDDFSRLRVVLVEPAGARNLGSVARAMKNMGLTHLVIVNPQCDPASEEAQYMAVHGQDVLGNAQIVKTLPMALQGCEWVVATTSRDHPVGMPTQVPRTGLPPLLAQPSALVFGPEDRGLSDAELNYAQAVVQIPSHPAYPSLNLAQAVAICCYELYQGIVPRPLVPPQPLATFEEREGFYQHLEEILCQIGYLHPHTAASRMEKFRRLFNRSQLSGAEVAMLRGILRQMAWKARQVSPAPSQNQA
jgi:tRNA/rRNA methyltransferase